MSTYYKYVERQAEDNIDWSVIGKDISTMLQDEVLRRETLKNDLDNASREYGKILSNAPTGQHKGATDGVLDFASNLEQARLIQDRLLKSGQLKVKDYLKGRQNLTDGTTGLFSAAKQFQEEYAGKLQELVDGEASASQIELFKMTEGFGNWNKVGAYINPTTYEVSMGKKYRVKQSDGSYVYEMGDQPGDFFTVAELKNYMSLSLPKYDTMGALDSAAESLGTVDTNITYQTTVDGVKGTRTINVADITGEVLKGLTEAPTVTKTFDSKEDIPKEIMDIVAKNLKSGSYSNTLVEKDGKFIVTYKDESKKILTEDQIHTINKYHDYQEAILGEITANPFDALSVLTDYIGVAENGKKFEWVWSEKAAKGRPEAIYFEKDPQAGAPQVVFHDNQEEYIKEKLNDGLRQRLDQKVTDKFTPAPKEKKGGSSYRPEWKINKDNAGKHIRDYSVWIKPLLTGNPKQIQDALNKITNKNKDIEEAKIIDNGSGKPALVYKMRDGITKTIVNDISEVSAEDFVESVIFNAYGGLIDDKFNTMYKDIIKATDIGGITPVNYAAMDEFGKGKLISTPSSYEYVDNMTFGKDKGNPVTQKDIWDKNKTKITNEYSSSAIVEAIANSYQQAPDGKRLQQNPLNPDNFTITPLDRNTVGSVYHDDTWNIPFRTKDASGMVISSPFGPDLLIPVSPTYNNDIPALMNYLRQTVLQGGKYDFNGVIKQFTAGSAVAKFLTAYAKEHGTGGGETKNPGRGEGKKVKNKSGGTSR